MKVNIAVAPSVPTQRRATDRRGEGHLRLLDPLLERRHLNRASFHPFFSDRRIPLTVQDLNLEEIATVSSTGARWALLTTLAVLMAVTMRLAYVRETVIPPIVIAAGIPAAPAEASAVSEYQWSGYHRLAV